ncbi:CaiB/BaiF CoA-transferase family protein [Castellaniella sp. FW104-16D08]|uniref:CaiB/BaiF CoA transferase family protein n=1 Tax=unclassified Castellaniella TaxID=2617606 RepID=UPI0033148CEB
MSSGVLQGVRVLDLTRVLAGPWATQIFADMGADVIKVERPGRGDDTRGWGPPFLKDAQGQDTALAAYFLAANRGKKSVTINIATPAGADLVRRLAQHCDVVLENYKVGDMRRYGLDYAALSAVNPRLVYCSITGFGQSGPYRERAGYDFIIQGMGGLMSVTGPKEGQEGAGPCKVGVPIADLMTGMYASSAILAALLHRNKTGEGQYIDMALLDVQVGFLANQNMNYLASGKSPRRMGNAHPNIVPYQTFNTADGAMNLGVGNDGQFAKFCRVAGLEALVTDPLYATHSARIDHRDTLVPIVAQRMLAHTSQYWSDALNAAGVPCGSVNTIAEVFQDPQVQSRGMKVSLPHPVAGHVDLVANPIKFSKTPIQYEAPPPALGEHTEAVLAQLLGLADKELEALKAQGVV